MNAFTSNPVVIEESGKKIGVIELDMDPETERFLLEVTNKDHQQLFFGEVDEDTFLSFDLSHQILVFSYLDPVSRKVLKQKEIDLYETFEIYKRLSLFKEGDKRLSLSKEEELPKDKEILYKAIAKTVKEEMDSPKGTEKEIEHHTYMLNQCTMKDTARQYVVNKIRQIVSRFDGLSEEEIEEFTQKIYADFYGMGILQEIDDDPEVGEIMVNGYVYPHFHCDIYYVKRGKKNKYDKTFQSLDELMNVFTRAIAFSKKELNSVENAIVEATRSNGDRVNIIIPDASESYVMNIRKFRNFVPDLSTMKEYGTVDDFIDRLMRVLVKGKANIGIGGPMGTGKTTFINYLLTYTDPIELKVIIASVNETDVDRVLKGHHVVVLNVDEQKDFTFERLIRSSLRTTADRIIVPESRGEEFRQVYEANLKTKGNMFTAHALDDYSFLDACVDMYIGGNANMDYNHLKNKIAKSIDIVIIMRKVGHQIRIKSISEVVTDENKNFERMNLLYYWHSDPEDWTKGEYRRTENRLTDALKARLNEYGVPMSELKDL